MQAYDNTAVYNALAELAVIDQAQLKEAYNEAIASKKPIGDILLEKDLILDENLGKIIATTLKIPFVSLSKVAIPDDLLLAVPEIVAKKAKVIAFEKGRDGIKLAMSNPQDRQIIEFISKKTGEKIIPCYASERDIDNTLRLYQKEMQHTFNDILEEQVQQAGGSQTKDAPVAKIVDLLIEYAYSNKASDIHIEPTDKNSLVRFRIDGVLHDVLTLPKKLHDQVITRIKVLSRLRTDEHLSAQDGKMRVNLDAEKLDIRVSIAPIVEGEKTVLRLLSSHSRQFSLNELGISPNDVAKIKKAYAKPYGVILATGPTGSGKTTTIYAILKIINTRDKNIATIEDPVEYDIEGINQIQVNPKTNLTFADGLKSILRQDPDIIFVGEVRDKETAGIATNAAMTGHLVLSTLHTNDASTTLPRLIDMDIEPFLVASTVNVIIAQRLVRKICVKCRFSKIIPFEKLALTIPADLIARHFATQKDVRIYEGKGCSTCHNTGYRERVGIFEVLEISTKLRQLIEGKASAETIRNQAINEGMTTMIEDGLDKVRVGITTIEEVLKATKA